MQGIGPEPTTSDTIESGDDIAAITVAIRRLDAGTLSSVNASSPSVRAAVTNALNLIGDPSVAGDPKRQRWKQVWVRLTEILSGSVPQEVETDGLEHGQISSMRDLIQNALHARPYHGCVYPLEEDYRDSIESLHGRLSRHLSNFPAPQVALSHKSLLDLKANQPDWMSHPVPKNWMGATAVTNVAKKAGRKLPKGMSADVASMPGWSPETMGDILDGIDRLIAIRRSRNITESAAVDWFNGRNIPEPFFRKAVARHVSSCGLVPDVSPERFEAAFGPLLPAMLEASALARGTEAFLAEARRTSLRYFPEDLGTPSVRDALKQGDIVAAATLLADFRKERVTHAFRAAYGSVDLSLVGAPGRPVAAAPLVRSLMPALGANFRGAAKAVALDCGGPSDVARFVEVAVQEMEAADRQAAEQKAILRAWDRSLVNVNDARAALGATPTEFKRWVDDGTVPVAKEISFRKWGTELTTTLHDPVVLARLAADVPALRAKHAAGVSTRRKAAGVTAAAARAVSGKAAPGASPASVRKRRLAGWLKTASPGAAPHEKGASVPVGVPSPWAPGGAWSVPLLVTLPPDVEALLDSRQATPTGKARAAAVAALSDGLAPAAEAAVRLAAVATAWEERVEAVAAGFPEGGSGEFSARLRTELAGAFDGWGRGPGSTDHLVSGLAEVLGHSLVSAVNVHARTWGVEDLRARSGLADYAAMFPEARAMSRRLVFHVGPTNSGKTHAAMERLAASPDGAYLAPLRLMALEGADRMNGERGVPTDMVTGEEEVRVEGARHVSSTIEMADLSRRVGVAVIDEVQLISDRDRGWAWTQALVGIPAEEVILTGSVDALPYITRIARMTGDTLEVREFERLAPLVALEKPVGIGAVRAGDALVAFSRAEVLRLRDEVAERGMEVATIYGALGPEVRRTQAARFRSGAAAVLVATDAIAMGLNLPIRRVLLSATEKYDGVSTRPLYASEIRQIGGRAGRYGLAEGGEVGVMAGCSPGVVAAALSSVPRKPSDNRVPVMPPWHAVESVSAALSTEDLPAILRHVTGTLLKGSPDLRAPDLDETISVAHAVADSGLSLRHRFRYLGCPVDTRTEGSLGILARWARTHGGGGRVQPPSFHSIVHVPGTHSELAECEQGVKLATTYLWLSMRWGAVYAGREAAVAERDRLNGLIEAALRRRGLERSCRRCGCRLSRRHRFPICEDCFHGGRDRY